MTKIRIALREWTRFPGGRFKTDGEHSGEEFREKFLEMPIRRGEHFEIDFNGIFTAGWSFMDESLGHYVTELGEDEFRNRFTIIANDDPDILEELETVIERRTSKK